MAITPIPSVLTPAVATPSSTGPTAGGAGFGESIGRLLSSVDQSTATANDAVSNMLDGSGDVHQAMMALQRAEMTLQLTVQVRNKLISAYQEIMRMPV